MAEIAGNMAASGSVAIRATALTKTFRRGRRTLADRLRFRPDRRETFPALAGVDLEARQGEILAILGPNGAGKTTTVRIIATLLEPTSGDLSVFGVDARQRPAEVRRQLGVVLGGERSVYWKLTGRENLQYFAALQHIPRREEAARIESALAEVELTGRADDYVERYSTGMRQRLALARALLGRPRILVLDEPTSGLDPHASAHLRSRIRDLCRNGTTVILTTHDMTEADQLADRLAILDHGRVVAVGPSAELKRAVKGERVVNAEVRLSRPEVGPALVAQLDRFASVTSHTREQDLLRITMHAEERDDLFAQLLHAATAHEAVLRQVSVAPITLEDAFLELTGRGLRE